MTAARTELADLHVHTTASDGMLDVAEVLARASRAKLRAVSITDHDTVAGYRKDPEPAKGLEVVPGIELSCDTPWGELHMLGYHLDVRHGPLLERLEALRLERVARLDRLVDALKAAGVRLAEPFVEDVRSRPGSIGRPHLARQLVKMAVVSSFKEAFDRYLGEGRPAYVPHRNGLTSLDAVRLILAAGGVAVAAHPGKILERAPEDFLPGLHRAGLRGIEVNHPSHGLAHQANCRDWARKLGLLETGGSDFHADEDLNNPSPAGRHCDIGGCTAPYTVVAQLRTCREKAERCEPSGN
jgi:hypothetical protein